LFLFLVLLRHSEFDDWAENRDGLFEIIQKQLFETKIQSNKAAEKTSYQS